MAQDYQLLKIDTDRMQNGARLAKRLRGGASGGIPWIVILDGEGEQLITSDSPEGNIGCPISKAEAAWFFAMLERTKKSLSAQDLKLLEAEHAAFAKPYRR